MRKTKIAYLSYCQIPPSELDKLPKEEMINELKQCGQDFFKYVMFMIGDKNMSKDSSIKLRDYFQRIMQDDIEVLREKYKNSDLSEEDKYIAIKKEQYSKIYDLVEKMENVKGNSIEKLRERIKLLVDFLEDIEYSYAELVSDEELNEIMEEVTREIGDSDKISSKLSFEKGKIKGGKRVLTKKNKTGGNKKRKTRKNKKSKKK